MAHALMFDADDPLLARVRDIALALPDAQEKVSHGRPAFFTTKIFTTYGGSVKVDGEWVNHTQSILVLLPEEEREAVREDPRFYVPGYWGPWGWLGFHLSETGDWGEVSELIEESYRQTASARRVAALDSRS